MCGWVLGGIVKEVGVCGWVLGGGIVSAHITTNTVLQMVAKWGSPANGKQNGIPGGVARLSPPPIHCLPLVYRSQLSKSSQDDSVSSWQCDTCCM